MPLWRQNPLVWFDVLHSTNDFAIRLVEQNLWQPADGPLWIGANRQTGGRGRRGRKWDSPSGNLYATFLYPTCAPPTKLSQISLVTAVALHDAISRFLPEDTAARLRIKWPNDLLLSGSKICGILTETAGPARARVMPVAIGCGINIAHVPKTTPYAATALNSHASRAIAPVSVLDELDRSLAKWLAVWNHGENFASLREAWCAHSFPLGTSLIVDLGTHHVEGDFGGLDEAGALLLKTKRGETHTILAGDVRYLRPAS